MKEEVIMHVQIISFDGPRDAALVTASERAGRDRIAPLVNSNPELRSGILGAIRGVGPDGAECVVVLARDAASLDTLGHVIMTSELLPGEDPALLPGPNRFDAYPVAGVFGRLADLLAGAEQ